VVVVLATLRLWRAWLMRFCALAFSAIFCFCVREYLREETVAAKELAQTTTQIGHRGELFGHVEVN